MSIDIYHNHMYVLADAVGSTVSPPFFAQHVEQAKRKANLTIEQSKLNKEDFRLFYIGTISYTVELGLSTSVLTDNNIKEIEL